MSVQSVDCPNRGVAGSSMPAPPVGERLSHRRESRDTVPAPRAR
jgi:hypothetical protein